MVFVWRDYCFASEDLTGMLGDRMTKDDKGDQPSGGEMTWTNTGATRSGRGQDQNRLTWRRHAEAFAQPRDTMTTSKI